MGGAILPRMSLEALLENDTITIQTNATAQTPDTSGGISLDNYVNLYTSVPARVEDRSASGVDAFGVWGQLVKTTVYTKQTGLAVKQLIVTSDGRKLVIDGVKFNRAIGHMPNFYTVSCSEYRPGT